MVNVTIDGKKIQVREGTTIMDAAARCGIPIPSLCYLRISTRSPPAASVWWSWREREADYLLQ